MRDCRSEPLNQERVPYVFITGPPRSTLLSCVREPHEFLSDPSLQLNTAYYVTGHLIPTLNRILNPVGVDAHAWYLAVPRRIRLDYRRNSRPVSSKARQTTILNYFFSRNCHICEKVIGSDRHLCTECSTDRIGSVVNLETTSAEFERSLQAIRRVCLTCTGETNFERINCISVDCPVFFRRFRMGNEEEQRVGAVRRLVQRTFPRDFYF